MRDIKNNEDKQSEVKGSKEKELVLHYMTTLVEVARESFLILDPDLKVISANPVFYQSFRVSPEQTENKFLYELGNGQWNIPKLRKLLEEILPRKKVVKDYEVNHIFETIGEKTILLNGRQISMDTVQMIVLAMEDITARKELQDKLVRAEKLAVMGKLAGIMGHEIRNPLGVIRNSIYFLAMKFKGSMDEKVKRHMDIMQTEIDGCDKIISDVLEFARTRPPSVAEVEINRVVEAVFSKASIPKTVNVQTDLGENLPKLNIDRTQIEQVFFNIISNAIGAMPKGGELRVTTSQTDTFISIAFKDTGVGIPEENISKLFEPLFSTKAKGLGLGLVACQNIISAHQGKIEFESKEGQGTTFIIKLPIAQKVGTGQEKFPSKTDPPRAKN